MSTRRDYKHTATTGQRRRRTVRRHGLLVVTLVLIGGFGGLLAYIKGDRNIPSAPNAVATVPAATPVQLDTLNRVPAQPPVSAPAMEPAAPIKPKYDFYTKLPKRQIDVQREDANPHGTPSSSPTPPIRTQPAVDRLRKPAAPRKSTAPPTVAKAARPPIHHDATVVVKTP